MADKSQKEATPPPLLLMPASGGLTFNTSGNDNVLMPVPQAEPTLFASGLCVMKSWSVVPTAAHSVCCADNRQVTC